MDIAVREIRPSDYPAVVSLWNNELGNGRVTEESLGAWYAKMAGDSDYVTYVAEADGVVAGFVTLVRVDSVDRPHGYMKLNGIAVREDMQGRGVGSALIAQTERRCRETGADSILLCTGTQRTGAHEFYRKLGFDMYSYCFTKRA